MTEIFTQFWWLIFPVFGLVMAVVQTVLNNRYEQKRLDLMKTYLDRGLPLPETLKRPF